MQVRDIDRCGKLIGRDGRRRVRHDPRGGLTMSSDPNPMHHLCADTLEAKRRGVQGLYQRRSRASDQCRSGRANEVPGIGHVAQRIAVSLDVAQCEVHGAPSNASDFVRPIAGNEHPGMA